MHPTSRTSCGNADTMSRSSRPPTCRRLPARIRCERSHAATRLACAISVERRSFDLNGATVAFAGRLTAQKALGRALEALAETSGVLFVIAGEGPDREPLERRARELGLSDRVRFIGAQPRRRVVELFRAADATILSSSWENFPHTVVEALAVGTPVLAMDAGGVAEVVRDGVNGLLVPAGDTRALAAAMRPCSMETEPRLGKPMTSPTAKMCGWLVR